MSRMLLSVSSLALGLGFAAPVLAQAGGGCTFGQSWAASGGCSYEDRNSGEDAVQRGVVPEDEGGDECGDDCGDPCGDGCGDDSAESALGRLPFLTLDDLADSGLV